MIFFFEKVQEEKSINRPVSGDILETMNFHILEWQCNENLSLKQMWKLPEKKFLRMQGDLVDFIEWKFHSVVKKPYLTVNGKRLEREVKGYRVHGKY